MDSKKILIIVVLLCLIASTSFAVNIVVTGNPSFDSDGNTITTNVSSIGSNNASKTCGLGVCTYNINGTFATPYASITDANYSVLFIQNDISALGNVTQGYINSTGSKVPVCTNTNLLLPTSATNFTCNMSSIMTSPTTYLYTDISAVVVAAVLTYDYAEVNITAGSTVITSVPVTITNPGTYVLTSNLTNGTPTAISIQANDVILDCQGHSLTGTYTNSTQGVAQNAVNNFTLQNCIIREYGTNLFYGGGNTSLILNNTFDNSSQTNVVWGSLTNTSLSNFTQNIVSNGFNNGIEDYSCTNCVFDNNTIFGQLLGHGTDRGFQFVFNNNNVSLTHNYFSNNTFCLRSDNNNMSNIFIAHNICMNNLNGVNEQGQVGYYTNVTYFNNSITSTAGNDWSWGGISTTVNFCAQTIVENNSASGFPYMWFNSSYSNTAVSNLNIGTFGVCDADNFNMTNITTQSPLGTVNNEFMQVSNVNLNGLSCTNSRVCLRVLTANDSMFSNIVSTNGNTLPNINLLGGQDNRNIVENFTLNNSGGLLSVALGGNNNTIRNGMIINSYPTTGVLGYQSATVGTGNSYDNISMYNVSIGIIFTLSSNNSINNIYIENATNSVLVNSTASGNKSLLMRNITVAFSGGENATMFDLADDLIPNEIYTINPYSSSLPFNSSYLHTGKNFNISNLGAVNTGAESLNMSWNDSEIATFDENRLQWWYNDGATWTQLAATLDAPNNKLSYTNYVVPAGTSLDNELFYFDMCPVINTSGVYYQHQNYFNATNPSAPYLDFNCVDIRVADVVWDCQGFNITNVGSPNTTIGVLAAGNNVTVQNCNIGNYSYNQYSTGSPVYAINNTYLGQNADVGLSFFSSAGSQVHDNTFTNLSYGTIFFFGTDTANISHNTYSGSTIRGIDAGTTTGSNFEFNTFTGDNVGLAFLNANGNTIHDNNFTNIGFIGLQLVGADLNIVNSNRFQSNSYSIDISSGSDFNHLNLNIVNSTSFGTGISISQSTGNVINLNNVTNSAANGIYLDPSSFTNSITNNLVNSNTQVGIRVDGQSNTISGNTMTGNLQPGFAAFNTNSVTVTNNTATGNSAGFAYQNASNSVSSFNHAVGNTFDGGYLIRGNGGLAQGNTFTNDSSNGDIGSGFKLDTDTLNNTITNCTVINGDTGINLLGDLGTVDSCSISQSSLVGIIVQANNSLIENNLIFLNNPNNNSMGLIPGGIVSFGSINTTITNNNIHNNPNGIISYTSTNDVLNNNVIHDNWFNGYFMVDSTPALSGDRFYNNTQDVFTNYTTGGTLIANGIILDNPVGNLENYSNISISDTVVAPSSYLFNWSAEPAAPPTNVTSINQKYILIQNLSAPLNINTTQFNWNSTEEANETRFLVMYYDGASWVRPSQTLNTGSNYISFSPSTPGTYALLDNLSFVPPPPAPSGGQGIGYTPQNQSPTVQFPSIPSGIIPTGQNIEIPQICLPIAVFLIIIYLFVKNREKRG